MRTASLGPIRPPGQVGYGGVGHHNAAQIKVKEKDPLAMDPLEKVELDGLEKFTYVSSLLSDEERAQLRLSLLRNIDVFS